MKEASRTANVPTAQPSAPSACSGQPTSSTRSPHPSHARVWSSRSLADQKSLDARLHDAAALEEIELYGDVVIAASTVDRPLTLAEIDAALGLTD